MRMLPSRYWNGCLLLWLLLGCCGLLAQPQFFQYSTKDGLPSSEVYVAFEDKDGFMWFGTDNGVAKFDGYEFTVYDNDDGLEDVVVFSVMADVDGQLWVSTYSGQVFYFAQNRFYPFGHNDLILNFDAENSLIHLVDITEDKDLILRVNEQGFVKLSQDGEIERLTDRNPNQIYHYTDTHAWDLGGHATKQKRTLCTGNRGGAVDEVDLWQGGAGGWHKQVVRLPFKMKMVARLKVVAGLYEEGEGDYLFTNNDLFYLGLDKGISHYSFEPSWRINYAFTEHPGQLWVFLGNGGGLHYVEIDHDQQRITVDTLLVGHSLSSGLFDQNGGLWVASLDAGIFYCPNPDQYLFGQNNLLINAKARSVALWGDQDLLVGFDDGSIYHFDGVDKNLEIVPLSLSKPNRVSNRTLYYDNERGTLYTPTYYFNDFSVAGASDSVNYFSYKSRNHDHGLIKTFYRNPWGDADRLYFSSKDEIGYINLATGAYGFYEHIKDNHIKQIQCFAPTADGKLVVGTLVGLYEYIEGLGLVSVDHDIEALRGRVEVVQVLSEDHTIYGTRGSGVVIQGPDSNYLIQEVHGLASNLVRSIYQAENGEVWVSTLDGVSVINFSADFKDYNIRTYRSEHGLPDEEIHGVAVRDDVVWLATTAGLLRFEEPPLDSFSRQPNISRLLVDQDTLSAVTDTINLGAGQKDLDITFGTVDFRLAGNIFYRYRLNSTLAWRYTRQRRVNFSNLPQGAYRFEVQSQNRDGYWSESATLYIEIATYWYNTWAARIGLAILLFSGVYGFFFRRDRQRQKEQAYLLQINELERSALHAQMNPHFVFNCLNSVQNFMLINDQKQAVFYLSRFAQLIRQTLNASVKGEHSLEEEISMLDNYLQLEKLRFKEGFTYEITSAVPLNTKNITLPPLLIQPFIENAVLHGLKGRKSGGLISVRFAGDETELQVTVTDNGHGIDQDRLPSKDSLGMKITRRRLNMLQGIDKKRDKLIVQTIYDQAGEPKGTQVTLSIKTVNKSALSTAKN